MTSDFTTTDVAIGPKRLYGSLFLPQTPQGLVIFAHGSGSSRFSPRNRYVAERLVAQGFACLLFDLLTAEEGEFRRNVFDIPLLGARVVEAIGWVGAQSDVSRLPIGLFGASTGAAAALVAAADEPRVAAVVSRGGRPDLAGDALRRVQAPTLLIVGGLDYGVIELNRDAQQLLRCRNRLDIVPGATHLFEEPGTLESVVERATRWFDENLSATSGAADA
ncbi:dienelactone hydrolase family protein [Methylocystis hirsuta]|jgi:putative phosphoribosyl transferase|uniref:Alpha/beta hydrolase n=1 Tax=Methylocystis hirsuta TaxID=369798 RepID=A0A3M9XIN8_9HYPH|nr:alpha/beta family hydrolase [Methylocystis hirsuta]RNJ47959.1 alpha/beta hydrolase [Methylocystis hirsuta]